MPLDILGLPDEGRDALMSAALGPQDEALDAWRRWENCGADPRVDLVALRWLPLIGQNLRRAPIDEPTRVLFQEATLGTWASNTRILHAARPPLDALAAAGVRTILLKGAALALTVYEQPGLRLIGDVDVLIEIEHVPLARRLLQEMGWEPLRNIQERDLLFRHGIDLQRSPHGALDLHWYLLHECCWPGADRGLWRRALPLPSAGALTYVLSPADQLLHTCLHGLRWSPVHAGHWVADAARVITAGGSALDWQVLVSEAAQRRVGLQMAGALRALRERTHVAVPAPVLLALEAQPRSWRDRWECRFKGRPVASAGGLFVIWAGWVRAARASHAAGVAPPPWRRFLAAALGAESDAALASRLVTHVWSRTVATLRRAPRRGASTRTRLADSSKSPH